jgi:NADH kinase
MNRLAHISNSVNSVGNSLSFYRFKSIPKNVLIVTKPNDAGTMGATMALMDHFTKKYPQTRIHIEQRFISKLKRSKAFVFEGGDRRGDEEIDFVVTLGGMDHLQGDGTVLHASSLFPKRVPPIVSFSLGSLGFMLPFCIFP